MVRPAIRRRVKIILPLLIVAFTVTYGYPTYSAIRWTSRLRAAAAGADRLKIWQGGPSDFEPPYNSVRFETSDTNLIAQVLGGIRGKSESYLQCMCFGAPSIVFYKGEQELAAVSLKHGKRLLWYRNGHGDVTPTAKSMALIKRFLLAHGMKNAEVE